MSLTRKQQRFVQEYLIDLNATRAAVRAGYSAKTADDIGPENLRKKPIAAAIEKAFAARAEKAGITAERVLEEAARIAFADIRKAVEWDGETVKATPSERLSPEVAACVAEVAATREGTRLKFHAKDRQIENLMRHLGLFNDSLRVYGPTVRMIDMTGASGGGDGN